ncbi:hypothetical protein [Methanocella conradii]|uniref:hypothetical protein n=1 Tax=Methanocella conradii TaxID=1175444 RepID=UPI001ED95CCB|nr:hypothetical protein [Methanocella conradii]
MSKENEAKALMCLLDATIDEAAMDCVFKEKSFLQPSFMRSKLLKKRQRRV